MILDGFYEKSRWFLVLFRWKVGDLGWVSGENEVLWGGI